MDCACTLSHCEGGAVPVKALDLATDATHDTSLMRDHGLHREGFDVLGAAFPVSHVVVLVDAHGLARIGARYERVLVGAVDDGLLVEVTRVGLLRGDEARADPDALRAQRQ